ncbi:septin-4 [Gracilinanus agilis]|uniref:septin-4 n=1 Tax=Gracilinanus agilis TaxID=191870 RepID=UPI001CFEF0D0|nr:septin-4 [Gracilinanus agilis]
MGSTQKGSMSQTAKMSKVPIKVSTSVHRGAEVNSSLSPHRGPSFINQRGADLSQSVSPQRGMESRQTAASQRGVDTSRPASPPCGTDFSRNSSPQGNESGYSSQSHSKAEASRPRSPHRKSEHITISPQGLSPQGRSQKFDAPSHSNTPRMQSPPTQDQPRKNVTIPGQEGHRTDAKNPPRASQSQREASPPWDVDPPSKVTNPQGVRSPRRRLINPKDECTQTTVYVESKPSLKKPVIAETHTTIVETKPAQRVQEAEAGPRSIIHAEAKGSHRNLGSVAVESAVKVSFRKDHDHAQKAMCRLEVPQEPEPAVKTSARATRDPRRVTILTDPDAASSPCRQQTEPPSHKPPILSSSLKPSPGVSEQELTPRPLPPRSLPKYGPESSWWILFHPEPSEQPPKCPENFLLRPEPRQSHLDLFMSQIEIASAYCEELIIQREKATSPEPQFLTKPSKVASRDFLKTALQPLESPACVEDGTIQRFSAFFLGMF